MSQDMYHLSKATAIGQGHLGSREHEGTSGILGKREAQYPLVMTNIVFENHHLYPFIVSFPIENGDFP